jgi:hypothetical protein
MIGTESQADVHKSKASNPPPRVAKNGASSAQGLADAYD